MFKKMVIFQGCSFTWGQNLHHYEWIKKKDVIFPKNFFTWPVGGETRPRIFDWSFHEKFRDAKSQDTWLKLRASSVLSRKLKEEWSCVNDSENGGSNSDSIFSVREFVKTLHNHRDNFENPYFEVPKKCVVVLQLTHAGRDYEGEFSNDQNSPTWKEESTHVLKTVEKIDELYEELKEQNIHLITWSWPGDLGWLTKDKPYSCGIRIGEEVFDSFDEAQLYSSVDDNNYYFVNEFLDNPINPNDTRLDKNWKPKHDVPITINQSLGMGDDHPSKEFHEVIADSIYQRMNELDLL
tara:strand:- start:1832 stop:2713 length:882 start_codon:yes stop_codon:yes gene_type:complete